MRRPCSARAASVVAAQQRITITVALDTHPLTELVAARVLLLLTEELRVEGLRVRRVEVRLHGALATKPLPPP